MIINVVSRQYVEKLAGEKLQSYWGVISIRGFSTKDGQVVKDKPLVVLQGHPNVLRLYFEDITPFHTREMGGTEDGSTLFTAEHAKNIHSFVDKAISANAGKILVHCEAGISRSGAVGSAINDYVNRFQANKPKDWDNFFNGGCERHLNPNPHVSRLLKEELGFYNRGEL